MLGLVPFLVARNLNLSSSIADDICGYITDYFTIHFLRFEGLAGVVCGLTDFLLSWVQKASNDFFSPSKISFRGLSIIINLAYISQRQQVQHTPACRILGRISMPSISCGQILSRCKRGLFKSRDNWKAYFLGAVSITFYLLFMFVVKCRDGGEKAS